MSSKSFRAGETGPLDVVLLSAIRGSRLQRDGENPSRSAPPRSVAVHPKAMPVILTTPEDVEAWMTAPPDEA
jgi:hypothetical protein